MIPALAGKGDRSGGFQFFRQEGLEAKPEEVPPGSHRGRMRFRIGQRAGGRDGQGQERQAEMVRCGLGIGKFGSICRADMMMEDIQSRD